MFICDFAKSSNNGKNPPVTGTKFKFPKFKDPIRGTQFDHEMRNAAIDQVTGQDIGYNIGIAIGLNKFTNMYLNHRYDKSPKFKKFVDSHSSKLNAVNLGIMGTSILVPIAGGYAMRGLNKKWKNHIAKQYNYTPKNENGKGFLRKLAVKTTQLI